MKVADVMSRHVDFVTADATVKEVARLIFGRGVNGVPVCERRKVVGFITEHDILSKFYPSLQEYIEDPVHEADFEAMEQKAKDVLSLTADKIMTKHLTTVKPETPLLRAQSLMFTSGVGRLPVVDGNGHLRGIVTNGDVFRAVIGGTLPFEEEEHFYDWMARYYDIFIDWKKRLDVEIPDLVYHLEKANVKKVLDIASSTGEHTIALAKEGFVTCGVEASKLITKIAENKKRKLSNQVRNRITFVSGKYQDTLSELTTDFDAAVFMGNALPHLIKTDSNILKAVSNVLNKQHAVMILQITNFDKIFLNPSGFRDFSVRKSHYPYEHEHAFLSYYTKSNTHLTYDQAIFDLSNSRWVFKGLHSTPVAKIAEKDIIKMLKKVGFKKVITYGGSFYGPLFKERFNPKESDWLNVVAYR